MRNALIDGGSIAARWQRLAGRFIDSLLIGSVSGSFAERGMSWWLIGTAVGVYRIVGADVWGATIGKVVAGASLGGDGVDGLRSADISRGAASTIAVLALVTRLATYTPTPWDDRGRGLRDRLAGSVVVRR